jgi:hypothetical protein
VGGADQRGAHGGGREHRGAVGEDVVDRTLLEGGQQEFGDTGDEGFGRGLGGGLGHAGPGGLAVALARGEDGGDGRPGEAARGEGEGVQRGGVEPVGVVHAQQQGAVGGGAGEQFDQAGVEGEPVGVGDRSPGQGVAEEVAPGVGEAVGLLREGAEEALEPGEGQVRLVGDPTRVEHGETTCGPVQVLQERRLAAPGAAGEEQGGAPAGPRRVQGVGEGPLLRVTTSEAGSGGLCVPASHVLTFAQRPPVAAGAGDHTGRFTDAHPESREPGGAGRIGGAAGVGGTRVRAWDRGAHLGFHRPRE